MSDQSSKRKRGFRVIDLRTGVIEPEIVVEAQSPEEAAQRALGIKAFRSGVPKHLVCRVYWVSNGTTNMVRLYKASAYPEA